MFLFVYLFVVFFFLVNFCCINETAESPGAFRLAITGPPDVRAANSAEAPAAGQSRLQQDVCFLERLLFNFSSAIFRQSVFFFVSFFLLVRFEQLLIILEQILDFKKNQV